METPPIYELAAQVLRNAEQARPRNVGGGGLPPGWTVQPSPNGGVDIVPGNAPRPPMAVPGEGTARTIIPSEPLPVPADAGSMVRPVSPTDAVPMERTMSPDQRINQAFDVAGEPPQRRPAPAAAAAPPPSSGGREGILPAGIADPLAAALSGLSGVRSTSSPLSALGQGAAGAISAKQTRADRKAQLAQSAEDRAYERERDRIEDQRWERMFGAERSDAERAAMREARADDLSEVAAIADIQKTLADTRRIERESRLTGMTPQQVLEVNRQVLEYGKQLIAGDPVINETERAEIDRKVSDYKEVLTTEVLAVTPGGATPAAARPGGVSEVPGMEPGREGEGTYEAPFTFTGPAAEIRAQVEALPSGTHYINPADGRIYRRP